MPVERSAKPMAEFFKYNDIGQRAAGLVEKFGRSDNGDFIILSPCVIKESEGSKPVGYGSIAIGLTTDLLMKITRKDEGKYLSVEFKDTEPTSKGSPRKIFRVLELTAEEFARIQAKCEATTTDPYKKLAGSAASADDEEDLPY